MNNSVNVDEKHINEIIAICKENGKEINRDEAVIELDRMRGVANIMIDHILKMTPEERAELNKKIQKEKTDKKLNP